MSIEEENKEVVLRFFEVSNRIQGRTRKVRALAREFLATDFKVHHSMGGDMNPEQWIASYKRVISAFPDMSLTVVDLVAEGDKVVAQYVLKATHKGDFQGIPPTGSQVIVAGIAIYRIAGGKIAEDRGILDNMGLMQQLGAIPSQ